MLSLFREIKRLEGVLADETDPAKRAEIANDIWQLECDAQSHYE